MKLIQIRSLAAVIVALTVIGCASTTPTSIKDRTLETVQRSKKSAQEVTNCIVPKWEELSLIGGSPMVNFRPTDNGFRVTMHIDNRLAYMAEIENISTGSQINLYTTYITLGGDSGNSTAVKACQ